MSQLLAASIELESFGQSSRDRITHLNDDKQIRTSSPPPVPHRAESIAHLPAAVVNEDEPLQKPQSRMVVMVAALSGVTFATSVSTAMVGIGAPVMAQDLGLDPGLQLWPASVFFLSCGSLLLLAGAVADVLGHTRVMLTGSLICGVMTLCCGWVQTGIQLIMFRAITGVGLALCSPTSVAIISNTIPAGRPRNLAFACLGFSAPLGFSIGLVLEGVLLDTIGWRAGMFMCGTLNLVLFLVYLVVLPKDKPIVLEVDIQTSSALGTQLHLLKHKIDWIGALLACSALAILSYVLAILSQDVHNIQSPSSIAMLSISLGLFPVFALWQQRQERLKRPALIPNALWKNKVFTSVCLTVLLCNAVQNCMELFCNLFFQSVQGLSPLQSSLRILPSTLVGICAQISTGLLIHRASPFHLVLGALILSTLAPLLMALTNPLWPYWYTAFPAQVFSPISVDIIFTIGLLVVSAAFPPETQALAGAVFNTVAQFGSSLGLTVMQTISSSVTELSHIEDKSSPPALDEGYKASFWTGFASMVLAVVITVLGLRKMGRIGLKED